MKSFLEHTSDIGFKPDSIIDVGVGNGTPEIYRTFPQANYLLVEPLKEFEPELKRIMEDVNGEYKLVVASNERGTSEINVRPNNLEGTSTLNQNKKEETTVQREVQKETLDFLYDERDYLSHPILLKIDVQGAELDVLDGAKKCLKESELVILETQMFEFFGDNPQAHNIVEYMKEEGFVPYDFFEKYNRPLDNALAGIDIAFVKEDGIFRNSHKFY